MSATMTLKQLHGPDGATIELDRSKVVWDDPGADTPAIVCWNGYTGTYNCCLNTGEIECGDALLPDEVMAWLDEVHDEVHDFLYSNPPPDEEDPA